MADQNLIAIRDLHVRLASSLIQVRTHVLDINDTDAVRRYARQHLAQLVY